MIRWGVPAEAKVLLILPEMAEMVYLSSRNIPTVKLISANNLNVYDLLNADKIVTTNTALAKLQEVYSD
jgi:large subunit ribosomal protein L4